MSEVGPEPRELAKQYPESVVRTLRDLLGFGAMAARLVARGQSEYDGDETLRLAAEAIMHKIGEAVARLPQEFTADHPQVRWRSMKATRNLIAHWYGQVDYRILRNALAHRLPEEMATVARILGTDGSGGGAGLSRHQV